MCGFIGTIAKGNEPFPPATLERMAGMIVHRGPDDAGFYRDDDWLGLAFRRLSILDLSEKGHQPMLSRDGRYAIVYNGEVYNYRELRSELETLGESFLSDTDTEVVLAAYRQWGEGCVKRFVGMFAFLIADLLEKTVFAARDPLGIKPLFLFEDGGYFIFCSEIKSLLPYRQLEPDFSTVNEYLVFRNVLGAQTMFRNVRSILPGHCLTLKNGQIHEAEYFHLADTLQADEKYSFTENCDRAEAALRESVKLHLRSDVELGVQLSGGVDSSLITAMAAEQTGKRFHSFSISFPDAPTADESKYQKWVSEKYGTEHHDLPFGTDLLAELLPESIWHFENPLNDPNTVATYYLNREVRKWITVILAGEGADESFLGYMRFNQDAQARLRRRTWLYRHPQIREMLYRFWPVNKGRELFNITRYQPAMLVLSYANMALIDKLLQGDDSAFHFRHKTIERAAENILHESIIQDQICDLDQWFRRADRMGMASSVEQRVPFCTVPMFSLANSIPYNQKIYHGERKAVLKKVAEKYLDHEQIYRKKIGFGTPTELWDKKPCGYGKLLAETLSSESFRKREFINREHAAGLFQAFRNGQYEERNSGFLWTYLNLELWFRIFFEDGWRKIDRHPAG